MYTTTYGNCHDEDIDSGTQGFCRNTETQIFAERNIIFCSNYWVSNAILLAEENFKFHQITPYKQIQILQ